MDTDDTPVAGILDGILQVMGPGSAINEGSQTSPSFVICGPAPPDPGGHGGLPPPPDPGGLPGLGGCQRKQLWRLCEV